MELILDKDWNFHILQDKNKNSSIPLSNEGLSVPRSVITNGFYIQGVFPNNGLFIQSAFPNNGLYLQSIFPSSILNIQGVFLNNGLYIQSAFPNHGLYIQGVFLNNGLYIQSAFPNHGLYIQSALPNNGLNTQRRIKLTAIFISSDGRLVVDRNDLLSNIEILCSLNIIIPNFNKDKYEIEESFPLFYKCDHRKKGIKLKGFIHIKLDLKNLREWSKNVSEVKVEFNDKNFKPYTRKIKDNELSLVIPTNMANQNSETCFTFLEGSKIKLKFKIELITGKSKQREREKNQGNRGEENEKPTKGYYVKCNKITIIEEVLEYLKKNNWDLFQMCPIEMSEDEKNDFKKDFKKDFKDLSKEINIPIKDHMKDLDDISNKDHMKDLVIVIDNINVADNENKKIKNNLLILCFDIIYKSVILNLKNNVEGMTGYLRLFKKYNSGYSKYNNDIILIDEKDNKDQYIVENDDLPRKRRIPENENKATKKQKMNLSSESDSRQIDKNSDVEVLLVDH